MDRPCWVRLWYCEREYKHRLLGLNPRLCNAPQVNVGTSGAEIGAAFGGNKVSSSSCLGYREYNLNILNAEYWMVSAARASF
jgi:hypothetical protein